MTDVQLRQFLLRRLPADQSLSLEEAIVLEEGFAERLRDAEFDLLDDYAASRLNAEDATDVERYFLGSEENLNSIRVARALQQQELHREGGAPAPKPASQPARAEQQQPAVERRWSRRRVSNMSLLLAACLAAVVLIPVWLMVPNHPDPRSTAREVSPLGAAVRPLPSLPAAALPVMSLLADVSRGAKPPSIEIDAGAQAIRLQVEVPDQTSQGLYSVHIKDATGRQLFEGSALAVYTAGPYRFVEAVVPAAALAPGERTVLLTESDALDSAAPTFTWQVTGFVNSSPPK
jgi:hypothetical protein